jgi:hypothetical protein
LNEGEVADTGAGAGALSVLEVVVVRGAIEVGAPVAELGVELGYDELGYDGLLSIRSFPGMVVEPRGYAVEVAGGYAAGVVPGR